MATVPLDGQTVRLFLLTGQAVIASFWSAERSRREFGEGNYRPGWFSIADDSTEFDTIKGWEPIK